ncbi:MAG: class I tRNA ligase family protein [Syntrophales bacterium]
MQKFRPVNPDVVTIFTCGPSVYQIAHIGNFRTFLFEDILVRYLEFSGYRVLRGMNFTDIEDKAIEEARRQHLTVEELAEKNIDDFLRQMSLLGMKRPDYLPRASKSVKEAVQIIKRLLDLKIAYRHNDDIYFDPLRYRGFGQLYGLDMTRWPQKKYHFRKDTYRGMRWNLGDFILWHGCREGEKDCWNTEIGSGRPSWNIQDPSMIVRYFDETLSIYCGGIDNLIRHHDYTRAILESIRPYPMAKYWLHCHHLFVNGQKMSKSKGNIYYTDTLLRQGYSAAEIRFFLICNHYRSRVNYSEKNMRRAAGQLKAIRDRTFLVAKAAGRSLPADGSTVRNLRREFIRHMDDDLNVKLALDALLAALLNINTDAISPEEAAGIIITLKEIDKVLRVIF